jgi:hypothetical protein
VESLALLLAADLLQDGTRVVVSWSIACLDQVRRSAHSVLLINLIYAQ